MTLKMTIVNCTDVRLEGLKIVTAHRRDVDTINEYVAQLQYFEQDAIISMWGVLG